jgi:hypothetical protein
MNTARSLDDAPIREADATQLIVVNHELRHDAVLEDSVLDDPHAVASHLGPAGCEQFCWGHPGSREESLHVGGGGVSWLAGIDHGDPAEHQRGAQSGGAAADNHHVKVLVGIHGCVPLGAEVHA